MVFAAAAALSLLLLLRNGLKCFIDFFCFYYAMNVYLNLHALLFRLHIKHYF